MGIRFNPDVRKAHNQLPEAEKSITELRMRDDLGMAFGVVGALIRVGAIDIEVLEDGFASGYETDLDFAVLEIYSALRVQRAICSRQDTEGRSMLEVEQKTAGY